MAAAQSGEVGKKEDAKNDKNKFWWLNTSTNTVTGLIMVYLVGVLASFRSIMYPTFPDIDPHTHKYLEKFNNIISEGDELSVLFYGSSEQSMKERILIETFNFSYGFGGFQPFSFALPASYNPRKMKREKLFVDIVHQKTKRVLATEEEVVKKIPKPEKKQTRKLLSGDICLADPEAKLGSYIVRGYPKLQVKLTFDDTAYPRPYVNGPYLPKVFFDHTWVMEDELMKLSPEEKRNWSVEVSFGLQSIARYRFQQHMSQALTNAESMMGDSEGEEAGQLRDLLAQSDSYIFIVTMVVSVLHMIFEVLAFKHDVIFFQSCNENDLQYISVQSILGQAIMNAVLALYLRDEGANFLVIIFTVIGIFVELWKVQKVMKVRWVEFYGISVPLLASKAPAIASGAEDFDSKAMKWLMVIITPGIIGYGVWSLVGECHKGWYSYTLKVLASCVYGLGFVFMTPQVFINYKYKTVAYLPWKKFIYKALNTFIDDLFACIIRMPTMHRLSCFRDDVVFFIYLYQRWYYPVDKSRSFDEDGVRYDAKEEDANGTAKTVNEGEVTTESKKEK